MSLDHKSPHVTIIGAGAMGCLFAARLAERGSSVTLIDVDGERLSTMARDGIMLHDDDGERTIRVAAVTAAEVAAPVDLLMLFTKGVHSAAAIRSIAHLADMRPVALTLQNGIGNAELLAETFGADRVLMGTAHVPADLDGPVSVRTHGFGYVELGGFVAMAQGLAPSVVELLKGAGFGAKVAEDVNASVWEKVAFNAALNATAMICEASNGEMDNDPGRRLAFSVVDEVVAVAAARDIRLDASHIRSTIHAALREHAHHKASMLQDRAHGRATEIEMINGAIGREGVRLGVPTPVCDALSDLVRLIESRKLAKG